MNDHLELFPIMSSKYGQKRGWISFATFEPHRAQALRNHSQTLERLRERGGLSCSEALCVLRDRQYEGATFRDDVSYHKWEDAKWTELVELVRERGGDVVTEPSI